MRRLLEQSARAHGWRSWEDYSRNVAVRGRFRARWPTLRSEPRHTQILVYAMLSPVGVGDTFDFVIVHSGARGTVHQ